MALIASLKHGESHEFSLALVRCSGLLRDLKFYVLLFMLGSFSYTGRTEPNELKEVDILELVKANPLGIVNSDGHPKYGDPAVDAAADDLKDILHPWTVPDMIALFRKSPWPVADRLAQKDGRMWNGWQRDERRQSHIVTILAASRDPRVVEYLVEAVDFRSSTIRAAAVMGLYNYFLPDTRFHQLPPEAEPSQHFFGNMLPMMREKVKLWWEINRDDLKIPANEKH